MNHTLNTEVHQFCELPSAPGLRPYADAQHRWGPVLIQGYETVGHDALGRGGSRHTAAAVELRFILIAPGVVPALVRPVRGVLGWPRN